MARMAATRRIQSWAFTLGRAQNYVLPLSAAAFFAAGTAACVAQASNGVTGTVTDPTGAVVPGAAVAVTNVGTQTTVNAVTSSSGTYAVTGLVPGRYTITVTAPGFSKAVRNDVNVEVTVQATMDIRLASGEATQTVEVNADLIALNTTQPELGTTIEPAVVAALPVAIGGGRGRQIDTLQFLAPGVQGDTFSHRINGGVDFQQEILYNGIPAPQAETSGFSQLINPPFELVSEFRLERSTFSAKYGLAQGAVTYQTVSGTNNYHGDAFYINRNEFFDATGYFNPKTPIDRENNYGFTVSGPLSIPHVYNAKDKTFFALVLDFASTKLTDTQRGTVPTAIEKTGDFSDFLDATGKLIPIFDPLTGRQFQYQGRLNVIDPARISRASATLLPFIPDPDPGLGDRARSSNRVYAPNAYPEVNHQIGFTVDHNLTSKQSLHYAQWRNPFTSTAIDGSRIFPQSSILQSTKLQPNLGSGYLLNYVNVLSPSLVFTAGVAWIGELNNQFSLSPQANFIGSTPSPIDRGLLPHFTFNGQYAPDQFGVSSGETLSVNRKLGLSAVNNWLWTKGRHTFNFGGEFRRSYQDDNECQRCTGELNFSQRTTADPANQGSTGSSFASFLLGQVDNANRVFANELRLRNLLLAPYVQDDIKFTPKLTVNVGLRWDIMLPFKEANNQIVFLDPNGRNPAAGNLPGIATRFSNAPRGVDRADISFRNFGPRIGFAYAVNDKTVIQAGFNIAFLNGGAFEFGTSKVATSYGNLLQGSFTANSTGGTTPGYGSYDAHPLPAPPQAGVGPRLGIGTEIRAFDPQRAGAPPYLQQWNVNVQRQLPWNTFLQVAYVGNHAVHLNGQLNPISQPDPSILRYGPLLQQSINSPAARAAGIVSPYPNFSNDLGGNPTVAHALSPFPQYSNVRNNFDLTGAASYNGLQTSLEKRFSNGLSFLTSYTLSKTLSNADSGFTTFAGLPENKYNQYPEYTVSNNDARHNAKVSGTYELPIGPGKRFANNKGITGQVLGGVQVGFILQYLTGTPRGVGENDNPLACAGCFNRPSYVPGVKRSTSNYKNLGFASGPKGTHPGQSSRVVVTPNAFVSTTGTYVLGNALRNITEFRNPGFYQEDVKASKKFALSERVNVVLEMNYFNILNRTRFHGPNLNIDDRANFGFVNNGQINSPRQGQISGRVNF